MVGDLDVDVLFVPLFYTQIAFLVFGLDKLFEGSVSEVYGDRS